MNPLSQSLGRPPERVSWFELLSLLGETDRAEFFADCGQTDLAVLELDWGLVARAEQLEPLGDWAVWLILAGRGWGKTRTGAEWLVDLARSNRAKNSAIVAPTARDLRRFCLEGDSGVLSIAPPWFYPDHKKNDMKLVWPNGAETHFYSAEEPDRLRGPNHDAAWCDELAAWRYLDETWDMLEMTLRKSDNPRVAITTTPKPRQLIRSLIADADTRTTRGHTDDNAQNLSARWLKRMKRKYQGTRLGRQELSAELLDEAEGALWKREWLDDGRLAKLDAEPPYAVVAIDPPATEKDASSEAGIVVAAADPTGVGYVLEDLSQRASPAGWARIAILAYFRHNANVIVAERNNGGDMVSYTIEMTAKEMFRNSEIPTSTIPVVVVWASRGKYARAEPVAALYEQGRVHHVGSFPGLEDQLCVWEPNSGDRSPDRLDALTWALTYLLVEANTIDFDAFPDDLGQKSYWRQAG